VRRGLKCRNAKPEDNKKGEEGKGNYRGLTLVKRTEGQVAKSVTRRFRDKR